MIKYLTFVVLTVSVNERKARQMALKVWFNEPDGRQRWTACATGSSRAALTADTCSCDAPSAN